MSLILWLPARGVLLTNQRLYCILTYAARKNILLQWISDKEPTVTGWHKVLFDLVPLEYLTCMVPCLNYLDPNVSAMMLKGFPERS